MRRAGALAIALATLLAAGAVRAAPPLDVRDLGAFFDGLLAGLMAERRIPGAVVAVVHDGKLVFARGYGVANLESGAPIDPATTLFRVASVSKLFTTTAVMQLVEEGKLDLDTDVNQYLTQFQIPSDGFAPITLRHLLTHTPGFDDAFLHGSERLDAPAMPLGAYLAEHLPARVQPPGALLSYSNHGIALAGYVVEAVTGKPLRETLRERVLLPLGMTQSGFSLPNPPPPELATGYDWRGGRFVATELDRMRWYPAGDLYTSAGEIARFMLAQLDLGRVPGSDARILQEDTARTMQARAFAAHPELGGWALGFDERRFHEVRAIGHGGSWNGYGTELVLVPEARLGLFVSTTRTNDDRFFRPLQRAFFERYFPHEEPRATGNEPPDAEAHAREIAGSYIPNRRIRGDLLSLGVLIGSLDVTANGESITLTFTDGARDPIRAVETPSGIWRSEDDDARVAVLRDAEGEIAHLALGAWTFDRVSWWGDPRTHQIALGACALLFAGTVIGFALGAIARLFGRQPASSVPARVRVVATIAAASGLTVLLAVTVGLLSISPFDLFVEVPAWLRAVGWLAAVAPPAAIALFVWTARGTAWTPLARLHGFVLAIALGVFTALVTHYHLIGAIG